MLRFLWLAGASASFTFVALTSADAAPTFNDYGLTKTLLPTPAHLIVNTAGLSEFDKTYWSLEKQDDGTELYSPKAKSKKKDESKAAIMRNASGDLESMTSFKTKDKTEEAGTLIYEKGSVRSYTTCEDRGEKDIGRVCVTATADLCHALKAGNVQPPEMKQMDTFEMRALAILLTLRGTDHQLENMVKSGNRLGLKSALQTTKGQLLALSRIIARESSRTPASVVDAKTAAEDTLAQTVLERSLPKLKQACLDTKFN